MTPKFDFFFLLQEIFELSQFSVLKILTYRVSFLCKYFKIFLRFKGSGFMGEEFCRENLSQNLKCITESRKRPIFYGVLITDF